MEERTPSPKTGMSGFKKFILIVLGLILLSFLLQLGGIRVLDVQEDDTFIERPHDR